MTGTGRQGHQREKRKRIVVGPQKSGNRLLPSNSLKLPDFLAQTTGLISAQPNSRMVK
jgi:hypothetical protein